MELVHLFSSVELTCFAMTLITLTMAAFGR